jgi:serine/threonine protein kinase
VDYCHRKVVANQDIKLENVLLGMENFADFKKMSLSAGK